MSLQASQHGADVLLLLGADVKQQLRTWTEALGRPSLCGRPLALEVGVSENGVPHCTQWFC